MPSQPDNEKGRELAAAELVEKTVVIVSREDRPLMYTAWVNCVGVDFVVFTAGKIRTSFIAHRAPDDTLTDDTGARIHIFEYLGEI